MLHELLGLGDRVVVVEVGHLLRLLGFLVDLCWVETLGVGLVARTYLSQRRTSIIFCHHVDLANIWESLRHLALELRSLQRLLRFVQSHDGIGRIRCFAGMV